MIDVIDQKYFLENRQKYTKEYFIFSFSSEILFNRSHEIRFDFPDTIDVNLSKQSFSLLPLNLLSKSGYYEIKPSDIEDKIGLVLVFTDDENYFLELKTIINTKNHPDVGYEENLSKFDTATKEAFIIFMKGLPSDDQKQVKIYRIHLETYNFIVEKISDFGFCDMLKREEKYMMDILGETSQHCDEIKNESGILYKDFEVEAGEAKEKSCENDRRVESQKYESGTQKDINELNSFNKGKEEEKQSKEIVQNKNLTEDKKEHLSDWKLPGDDKNKPDENTEPKNQAMLDSGSLVQGNLEISDEKKSLEKTEENNHLSMKINDNRNSEEKTLQENELNNPNPPTEEEKNPISNSIANQESSPKIQTSPTSDIIIPENEKPEIPITIQKVNGTQADLQLSNHPQSCIKDLNSRMHAINKNNLIAIDKTQREIKTAEDLQGNKFTNSYITFIPIQEIHKEIDITLVIIGHESSGRSSFIHTLLNYLEERDENTIVTEKYLQCYEDKNNYYKFGNFSQSTNELIIVNTKKFGGKKILIAETPHFSEILSPAFSEEKVIKEIDKFFIDKNKQIHIIITKKGDESYMNSNMEKYLKKIMKIFSNCELHYVYTFYASSIIFKSILKSHDTTVLKINNNIYLRKKIKSDHWLKLHKKIDKFLTALIEKNFIKVNLISNIMQKFIDNQFLNFPQIPDKDEKIQVKRMLEIIMGNNSLIYVKNKILEYYEKDKNK